MGIISKTDLQNAALDDTFYKEVINSVTGGEPGGSSITLAANRFGQTTPTLDAKLDSLNFNDLGDTRAGLTFTTTQDKARDPETGAEWIPKEGTILPYVMPTNNPDSLKLKPLLVPYSVPFVMQGSADQPSFIGDIDRKTGSFEKLLHGFTSFSKLPDPTTGDITPSGISADWSPDGKFLMVSHMANGAGKYRTLYERNGETITDIPIATGITDVNQVKYSPNGEMIAIASVFTPFLSFNERGIIPSLDILPTSMVYDCAWSPDSVKVAASLFAPPYIFICKTSSAGVSFKKLPEPAILPTGVASGCDISNDNAFLVIGHNNTPYVSIYKGENFDTKISNVVPLPPGNVLTCEFNPDSQYLAVGHNTTPFFSVYKRNGETFTKLPDPLNLVSGPVPKLSWHPDGKNIAVITWGKTFIYEFINDTLKLLNSSGIIQSGTHFNCTWSKDGQFLTILGGGFGEPTFANYSASTMIPSGANITTQQIKRG